MKPTTEELEQMGKDLEQVDLDRVIETIQTCIANHNIMAEEIRQIDCGERIVVPKSKEHAENMLKVAQFFLERYESTWVPNIKDMQ